jgi:ribonuclease PH
MTQQPAGVRGDGRGPGEVRPVEIRADVLRHPEGSAAIRWGNTWVICTATVENRQPPFLRDRTQGWLTAEYGMLPRSVGSRAQRGRPSGRDMEIQRLIGRSLRAVTDLNGLPLHTITVDCDVIDADGGTRAAAITGAFVALCRACRWMVRDGRIRAVPLRGQVAAVSAGLVRGRLLCDLDYREDSEATLDLTVVMTHDGRLVGLQAAAETEPIPPATLDALLAQARPALDALFAAQREALGLGREGPFDPRAL